jgi:hypothetical protein
VIRNRIFTARHRRSRPRPRAARGLAAVLTFMLVATLGIAARDSALAEEDPTNRPAAGRAVTAGPDAQTQACFPILDPGGDPVPGDGSDCRPPPVNIPPTSCGLDLTWSVQRVTEPDTGSSLSRIGYGGRIDCVGPERVTMNGRTRVVERTSGQPDGQTVGEQVLDTRIDNIIHPPGQPAGTTTFAATAGITNVRDENYPAAQSVEVIFEFSLKLVGSGPRGRWGPCPSQPPRPGLRYLSCSGENTDTLTATLGSNPFPTGVVEPPCKSYQWIWRDTVAALGEHVMATPDALFEWCMKGGKVQDVKLLSFLGNSKYPDLIVDPNPPNVSIVKSNDGKYHVTFPLNWRFNAETKVGVGVIGKDLLGVTFGINENCQISVALVFESEGIPQQNGTNPCRNWRPVLGQ